jgi:cytochrome c
MPNAIRNRGSDDPRNCYTKRVLLLFAVLLAAAACASDRRSDPSPATPIASADESNEERQRLVAQGRGQYLRCKSCHTLDAAAPPPFGGALGPHLEDIVGREAASVEGFEYTETLQALDLVWDEETLDQWLEQPHEMVPGMCEPFMGLANPVHRQALIAYLKTPNN